MLELMVAVISATFTLIIIMNPLLSVSMFINLTMDLQKPEMIRQSFVATGVAGALMLTFLIFNNLLFDLLGIEPESFKVAGGIILIILGLQIVLGLDIGGSSTGHKNLESTDLIGKKSMAGVHHRHAGDVRIWSDHDGDDPRGSGRYPSDARCRDPCPVLYVADPDLLGADQKTARRNRARNPLKNRRSSAYGDRRSNDLDWYSWTNRPFGHLIMVVFKPDLTKFLVFDLEAFVPSVDRRKRIGASLAVNAFRKGHTLLGGVVYGGRPLAGEVVLDYAHYWMWREGGEKEVVAGRLQARLFLDYAHYWMWREGGEKEVVAALYRVFTAMWEGVRDKKMIQADPVVCVVGISTFDMPFLLAKCLQYQVAPLRRSTTRSARAGSLIFPSRGSVLF